jgi:hypothetical protein
MVGAVVPPPDWRNTFTISRCALNASGASTWMLSVVTWLPVPVVFTSIVEETAIGENALPSALLTPSWANTGEKPPGWFVQRFKL